MRLLKRLLMFWGLAGLIVCLSYVSLISIKNYQWLTLSLFNNAQGIIGKNTQNLVLGETTDIRYQDSRVLPRHNFLSKYDSPLLPYSEKIVLLADKYGFHYGLLPAIAMVESNLCRKIPSNSYNCWGWGIYGKTVTRFVSFDDALEVVSLGIKKEYIDKGLTSPELIMTKYNPSNHNNWLDSVNFFMEKLD